MVNIKKAINDIGKGIGDEADAMVIICKKGDSVRTGILGIDEHGLSHNSIALALAMDNVLNTTKLKVALQIAKALQSEKLGGLIELKRTSGDMESHDERVKTFFGDKSADEALEEAARAAVHDFVDGILDKLTGGDDDADDD